MPGALNSLTIRMALQQQPQHEHDAWPAVDSTFMIQVTSPCDSASRLISSTFLRDTRCSDPAAIPCVAHSPIAVQTSNGRPQPTPVGCDDMRHWQCPTPNTLKRSRTTSRWSAGRAMG